MVKEAAIIAVAFLAYMATRKLLLPDFAAASIHARQIISLEKALGYFWEPAWQSWAIGHFKAAVIFLNWAYITSYAPVILLTGLAMYRFNRRRYYYYRDTVILALAMAIAVFILFPLAPPRMVPAYFVDTIQVFGPSLYGGEEMNRYVNIYAAMPSMHFSWGIIFGVICWQCGSKWIKALGVIYAALVFLAITVTGNHYITDAIIGGLITAVAFGFMGLARRIRPAG